MNQPQPPSPITAVWPDAFFSPDEEQALSDFLLHELGPSQAEPVAVKAEVPLATASSSSKALAPITMSNTASSAAPIAPTATTTPTTTTTTMRKRKKPSTSPPLSSTAGGSLTQDEKRANHIASEHKRRHSIKTGFERLQSHIRPTDGLRRMPEAVLLQQTVVLIQQLKQERMRLRQQIYAVCKQRGLSEQETLGFVDSDMDEKRIEEDLEDE